MHGRLLICTGEVISVVAWLRVSWLKDTTWAIVLLHVKAECSGVARLGHTGARALATGGHAPPVQARI